MLQKNYVFGQEAQSGEKILTAKITPVTPEGLTWPSLSPCLNLSKRFIKSFESGVHDNPHDLGELKTIWQDKWAKMYPRCCY